jgi:rare lipoprotein A
MSEDDALSLRLSKFLARVFLIFCLIGLAVCHAAAKPVTLVSSFYGRRHQGKKMANGKRYDRKLFTAAHKKLPLGTWLNVCFPKTGKCVEVEVTDRGPFKKKRSLDLSEAAATEIGLHPYGVGKVTIEVEK